MYLCGLYDFWYKTYSHTLSVENWEGQSVLQSKQSRVLRTGSMAQLR